MTHASRLALLATLSAGCAACGSSGPGEAPLGRLSPEDPSAEAQRLFAAHQDLACPMSLDALQARDCVDATPDVSRAPSSAPEGPSLFGDQVLDYGSDECPQLAVAELTGDGLDTLSVLQLGTANVPPAACSTTWLGASLWVHSPENGWERAGTYLYVGAPSTAESTDCNLVPATLAPTLNEAGPQSLRTLRLALSARYDKLRVVQGSYAACQQYAVSFGFSVSPRP